MFKCITKILHKLRPRAKEIAQSEQKRQTLFAKALQKMPRLKKGGVISDTIDNLKWLIKMLKSYFSGDYKEINFESVIIIMASIIYFVNPLDFLPDFLPGGLIDDAAILSFVIKTVSSDIQHYKQWYKQTKLMQPNK